MSVESGGFPILLPSLSPLKNNISFPSFFVAFSKLFSRYLKNAQHFFLGGMATAQRVSPNAIFRQNMKACPHVDLRRTIHLFVC